MPHPPWRKPGIRQGRIRANGILVRGILTATLLPSGGTCRLGPKRGGADDQRRLLAA